MRVLVDIDIILDALLMRLPWAAEAALLLSAIETSRVKGFIAGHTVTTIHYLVSSQLDRQRANTAVTDLLRLFTVVPLGDRDFQQAMVLELPDFEDAVQAAAALQIGAHFIISRDRKGYKGVSIPVRTAGEVLVLLQA